ncbi:RCC1/BLIP-II [Decorospora gaudefroyi]|uniref:RCC1/BLIP-II n=1 Tax=Decorospora gaudefroyi TaxID=184978 RepID=A0A6A5KFB9_9PLEO|nr:RCC1/BLIP-II [Decorospora gaudefroyi]
MSSEMPHQLYVFGSNGEGQLGIPAAEIVNTPTHVVSPAPRDPSGYTLPLDALEAIRAGDNHTLILTKGGVCYGAGNNHKKQLDPQTYASRLDRFKLVVGGVTFAAATCESSAFVFPKENGQQSWVKALGSGQWGEAGSAIDTPFTNPLPGVVVDFAAGVWHYVAIMLDGSVYGWGKARLGQLGDKLSLSGKITLPTKIEDIPFRPKKVVCGKDFTYLVGDPSTGEHIVLGKDKWNIISDMPDHVKGWKDMGATWHGIFILFHDGTLVAWGKENMWQLIPPHLPLIEKIAVGSDHILAVTKQRKLISWGWGKHGNCGDLSNIEHEMRNDMVSGFWNEIGIPGEIEFIGAGFCTSFVVAK